MSKISIATGMSAKSKAWKNKEWTWEEFVNALRAPHYTNEILKDFLASDKADQCKIKDVGGYVSGYLRGGRRKPENVVTKQMLTLDVDFAGMDFWDTFTMLFDYTAAVHSTHKHTESSPRLRLLVPLNREASPDEYVAVARWLAGEINIDLFDNTTFETNRLMFWQSTPKDQKYYFEEQEGARLDVDWVLSQYKDWKDTSLWPTAEREARRVKDASSKQQDPEEKKGVIGAFCRTYPIPVAIEKFLSEEYTSAGEDRYTYLKGSTSGGLMVYADKFAYSHHGTDPSGGKLCNSFDLVRLHRFGHLDSGSEAAKPQSFKAMEEFAREDSDVRVTLGEERMAEAKYDFVEDLSKEDDLLGEAEPTEAEPVEADTEWLKNMGIDGRGKYLSTAGNINLIIGNDPRLKDKFGYNEFDGKECVMASMPWRKITKPEPLRNVDYSGVRNYIESVYGISGSLKIDDCLALSLEKNTFHPVQEYLSGLTWDGTLRLDYLLVDYFGAKDDLYNKEAIRKVLTGAVARAYEPGTKFDLVLTLVGSQGTGKSTFIHKLGGAWYSDTFITVNGKEAFEQLQGAWIMEIAELSGLRKAEVEAIKHFISKQEDTFRPAFKRTAETFKRQCIFMGTTNNSAFLTDPTGNRRFLPIDLDEKNAKKSVFSMTQRDIDQIWAEAVRCYRAGEKLYLSPEANTSAKLEQKRHSEIDERAGLIEEYINGVYPENWGELDIYARRSYLTDPFGPAEHGVKKEYVCMAEVWCECLGKEKNEMDRYKTREINDILRSAEGWKASNSTKNFKGYGKQKYYYRE